MLFIQASMIPRAAAASLLLRGWAVVYANALYNKYHFTPLILLDLLN